MSEATIYSHTVALSLKIVSKITDSNLHKLVQLQYATKFFVIRITMPVNAASPGVIVSREFRRCQFSVEYKHRSYAI